MYKADPMIACQFPSASSIELSSWVLSGERLYIDSIASRDPETNNLSERLLDDLQEGDLLGIQLTDRGEMEIFVNGQSEGIAAINLPVDETDIWAVVDLYGACQQITVCPDGSAPQEERTNYIEDDGTLTETERAALFEPEVATGWEEGDQFTSSDTSSENLSERDSDDAEIEIGSDTELLNESNNSDRIATDMVGFGRENSSDADTVRNRSPNRDEADNILFQALNLIPDNSNQDLLSEEDRLFSRLEEQVSDRAAIRRESPPRGLNGRGSRDRRPVEAVAEMLRRWSNVGSSNSRRVHQREWERDRQWDRDRDADPGRTLDDTWGQELELGQLEQLLWSESMNIRRSQHDRRRRTRYMPSRRNENEVTNIPFHSNSGNQITIGSTFRTARLHTQLRRLGSTQPDSAPILFSAFTTPSSWSVLATPSWSHNRQFFGRSEPPSMDRWRDSFWFGITVCDPNHITTEWVHEQLEQNNRSTISDLLYVAVRSVPGQPLQLYEKGQLVEYGRSAASTDRHNILSRRGSIGSIRLPPSPTDSILDTLTEHKFEYQIRQSDSGDRTIQISCGSDTLSTHRTGRIPLNTRLPVYGFIILSGNVASCEIPRSTQVQNEENGLWQLAHAEINRLTDHLNRPLDEMSRLTNRPGRTWSRSAFRFREAQTQLDDRKCIYTMRSMMTSDNRSSLHLHTRNGVSESEATRATSYIIYEENMAVARQDKHFTLTVSGGFAQLEIGFINVLDHSKEVTKQLDYLCLRPIDVESFDRHKFSFFLNTEHEVTKIESHEGVKLTEAADLVKMDAIFSAKVNDQRHAVLSIWCAIDENDNGVWVEVAKSSEPLESRRAYIGYVRVGGEHSIKLLEDKKDGKKPEFSNPSLEKWVPFSMGSTDTFQADVVYTSPLWMKNEELIEFEVCGRNNEKWHALELGVFAEDDQNDLATLRRGQVWPAKNNPSNSNQMIGCTLSIGDRVGLVWRGNGLLGRVELIINSTHVYTLTREIARPFVRLHLNGFVTKLKILAEGDRSSIWSPGYIDMNRPTLGMLPLRQRQKSDDFRWDSRFKTSNVHMDKTMGINSFVVRQQIEGWRPLVATHTECRTIMDDSFHFEISLSFKNSENMRNLALCLIPRSETIIDLQNFTGVADYMKKQVPAILIQDKSVFYKCSADKYRHIGSLQTSLLSMKSNEKLGIFVEKGGEWLTGDFKFLLKLLLVVIFIPMNCRL